VILHHDPVPNHDLLRFDPQALDVPAIPPSPTHRCKALPRAMERFGSSTAPRVDGYDLDSAHGDLSAHNDERA
jgi:hypothetical protein